MSVRNHLCDLRQARGISAAALAKSAGISRQTVYAIEAGTYVPNTTVALRLARILSVSVEDLFRLDDAPPAPPRDIEVDLLSEEPVSGSDQPVQLCRVDARMVAVAPDLAAWCLPPADGLLRPPLNRLRPRVAPFGLVEPPSNRLIVAGCDPAMSVLARHAQKAGVDLILSHANSSRSLQLLKNGLIHVAGSHLRDDAAGVSNILAVRKLFRDSATVISYAVWEEGLLLARGNPKGIHAVEDLARRDVRIVNREPGAGSRLLLDANLRRLGIAPNKVRGYTQTAHGHLPAAWMVHTGAADACVATRAAARILGLDFVPLTSERYDLVVRKKDLTLPAIEVFLNTLNRGALRRELECVGGYDVHTAGEQVV